MKFLEKDLEQIIFETPGRYLADRGFCYVSPIRKRQLRIGNYGILDMISVNRISEYGNFLEISIFELKKEVINIQTFLQATRYLRGIQRYMESRGNENHSYKIVLAGSVVSDEVVYIPELFQNDTLCTYGRVHSLEIYTYDYAFDGIRFTEHTGYRLKDEGFKV